MTFCIPTIRPFPDFIWCFCHNPAINLLSKSLTKLFPHFPKSLLMLIGMVGEARLPSNVYFPWTPDYIPFILGPCVPDWTFLILSMCILTSWFSEMRFWYVDLKVIKHKAPILSWYTEIQYHCLNMPVYHIQTKYRQICAYNLNSTEDVQEEPQSNRSYM